MNYREAYHFLYNSLPVFQRVGKAAYKEGMGNSLELDKYFNYPHKHFTTIHVAGTNGKGSVSHILASVLQECGYRTGLYTSPHLLDYRERIKVNGKWIEKDFVMAFVEKHKAKFKMMQPSFFEVTVFLAFEYFKSVKVDVAVIEVGLGGRLDTTNVITPAVSVITNIGYDHMEFLGKTLDKIAAEKAGIIKEGVPVVVGEYQEECADVFCKKAVEKKAKLEFADRKYTHEFSTRTTANTIMHHIYSKKEDKKKEIETDLQGIYQDKNIITVLNVLDELESGKLVLNKEGMKKGFRNVGKNTGLMGRWQIIQHTPIVVCDVAHNEQGIIQVVRQINNTPHKKLHLILGFVKDKEAGKLLNCFPEEAGYYFTQSGVPRSMAHNELKLTAAGVNRSGDSFEKVIDAYTVAKQNASPDDLIFIGGSTFVVADFLNNFADKYK